MELISAARAQSDATIALLVQPRAGKSRLVGAHDGCLKLIIAAPPVEGKANREVVNFLASFFGIRKNQVEIISGIRSKKKRCLLKNVDKKELESKLQTVIGM